MTNLERIILEWSVISGMNWETMYCITRHNTIETMDFEVSLYPAIIKPDLSKHKGRWKVLYASRPTFKINKEYPSVYVAVRKLAKCYLTQGPQFDFDNDPNNNPIKFIELSLEEVPSSIFVTPGTIISTTSLYPEEKYVAILQTHVKKMLKLNPAVDRKRCVELS